MHKARSTRSANPLRPNWLNVTAAIVAFLFATGGAIFIARGGSFWLITSYSSLTPITWMICIVGGVGGYRINKRRDERRRDDGRG